jgi:hypothetical protein
VSITDDEGQEQERTETLVEKYRVVGLESPLVPSDVWSKLFIFGSVDIEGIRNALDRSVHFFDDKTPTWQKFLDLWSLTEAEFDEYSKAVLEEWVNSTYTDIASVTQVAGILMYLASHQVLEITPKDILAHGKQYCDKLSGTGALLENVDDWGRVGDVDGVLEISNLGKEILEFQEFIEYRDRQTKIAVEDSRTATAEDLLVLLRSDPSEFRRKLVFSNSEGNEYYNVPLLHLVPAKDILEAVESLSPAEHRSLATVFVDRYRHMETTPKLTAENDCLVSLLELVEERIGSDSVDKLSQLRMKRFFVVALRQGLQLIQSFEETMEARQAHDPDSQELT